MGKPIVSALAALPPDATNEEREAVAKAEVLQKLSSQAWRLNNLYWVEDENGKKVKFKPRWEQRELHNKLHSLNVVLKCRQPGISTYCAILAADQSLFCSHKTTGIIDKTDKDAVRKLEKIRFAYDHLDDPGPPADPSDTAGIGALVKAAIPMVTNNDHEIEWLNGSKVWAGTNMRGGTLQFLWITELGYISFYDPKGAEEIRKGALNTIHKDNLVLIESTHEGGKFGVYYALVKLAMEANEPLSAMDWKFHFFAWWRHTDYRLDIDHGYRPTPEELVYFARLEERGVKLSPEQRYWYIKKKATIGDAMLSEFPSVEEECFEAVIKGAIYGRLISALRAGKKIVDFEHDRNSPIFCFWDLGFSDYTAIWFLQFVGREVHALAYRCNHGQGLEYYVARVRELESRYEMPVTMHYVPHDADKKELTSGGKSARDVLRELGLSNTRVVTRTPDQWVGIHRLRALLPRFYFHKTECGRSWQNQGREMPGGVGCLEGYHTKEDASSGIIRETPVHDDCSHGSDALRTFAEAELSGLIQGIGTSQIAAQSGPGSGMPSVILAGWNKSRGAGPAWPGPRVIKN